MTTEAMNVQYITAARAEAVRKIAAHGAEDAARQGIGGRQHAGRPDVEPVGADIVARQPQRQGDESAENEEIVDRKTPDLQLLQGRHLRQRRVRSLAAGLALRRRRILARNQEEHAAVISSTTA